MKLVKKALLIETTYTPALMCMAELLRFSGESEMAKKFYHQILKQDNSQASATMGVAKACYATDDVEESF